MTEIHEEVKIENFEELITPKTLKFLNKRIKIVNHLKILTNWSEEHIFGLTKNGEGLVSDLKMEARDGQTSNMRIWPASKAKKMKRDKIKVKKKIRDLIKTIINESQPLAT